VEGSLPGRWRPRPSSRQLRVQRRKSIRDARLSHDQTRRPGVLELRHLHGHSAQRNAEPPTKNRQIAAEIKSIPEWFLPFVRKAFGAQNHLYWETYMRRGKVAAHPVWEFAPREARQGRVVLLGDALHIATPKTGAGAYLAMIDAVALGKALERVSPEEAQGLDAALEMYGRQAVARSDDLHRRSRSHASYFAPDPSTTTSPADFALNDQGTY
jgi:2-polyprenyl-6-methoxyphenol hydroxylase-like FAD-dependent oxidoreductase